MSLALPKRLKGQHASVKRASKQEQEIADRHVARVTKGSGNGAFEKGDVRVSKVVRVEAKTTQAASFRVTKDMISKLETQSLCAGELPVMEIEIDNTGERLTVNVIPVWALDMLLSQVPDDE